MWWGCWGVEPCLVGVLITVLRWEAAMIARGIDIDAPAVDWLKRFLLTCTLIMNVVPALWPREGGISAGMVAAHIMVPVLVFFLAEVMPIVQARCTQARRAVTLAKPETTVPQPASSAPAPTAEAPTSVVAPAPLTVPVEAPAPTVEAPTSVNAAPSVPQPVTVAVPVESPAVPVMPQPVANLAPVPASASAVELDGLGIPVAMQTQIRQLVTESTTPVTAVDIQRATRLPLSIAARVADRLTPVAVNGYAH